MRRVVSVLLAIGALIVLSRELELHLGELEQDIQALGVWAPLGFIGVFALLTPFWLSVDALCFAAGLLFPLLSAELYMIVATYSAATVIFILGRSLFKRKLRSWLARQPKFAKLNALVSRQVSFKLMLLLRLTPLPFALLSYAFAAASVRFWPYFAATSGIFIYNGTLVYLGYAAKHIAGLAAGQAVSAEIPLPLLAIGLLLTIAVMFYVARMAARVLDDMRENVSPPQ
ncbi:TVP38/TMEM64 family protein [Methylomonas methanica]|uniref:TVP38/TMEM64 family membrane protein n=1 Tax=Methylomonas methanica (strain DSM 25384 / MC09) TaxID=857087 RepID=F9ZVG5_METMM|nr:VTT domain-containing protein [Methylomonas methanica]AEG01947.1 SNARE associated Golgi protein-like protein [Methylomonas methanica MC09]